MATTATAVAARLKARVAHVSAPLGATSSSSCRLLLATLAPGTRRLLLLLPLTLPPPPTGASMPDEQSVATDDDDGWRFLCTDDSLTYEVSQSVTLSICSDSLATRASTQTLVP